MNFLIIQIKSVNEVTNSIEKAKDNEVNSHFTKSTYSLLIFFKIYTNHILYLHIIVWKHQRNG